MKKNGHFKFLGCSAPQKFEMTIFLHCEAPQALRSYSSAASSSGVLTGDWQAKF